METDKSYDQFPDKKSYSAYCKEVAKFLFPALFENDKTSDVPSGEENDHSVDTDNDDNTAHG